MKKIIYLFGFIAFTLLVACENEVERISLPEPSFSATGQWEITAYIDTVSVFGPFRVITFKDNSSNNDSITIQDSEMKFWNFSVKALLNEKDGTFQTRQSNCEQCEEGIGIKIANGKIVTPDSISFEIQFEDDITPYCNTYILKGHRTIN